MACRGRELAKGEGLGTQEDELEAGKRGGLAGVGIDRPHGLQARALREGRGKGF